MIFGNVLPMEPWTSPFFCYVSSGMDSLFATHYGSDHNQPRLKLASVTPQRYFTM